MIDKVNMTMNKFLPQLNRSTLNAGALLDIPSGSYVTEDTPTVTPHVIGLSSPHRPMGGGLSMRAMSLCNDGIAKTQGGTVERFNYACGLFKLMGFHVVWDGTTKQPDVTWYDTEGWSKDFDVTAFIKAKLYDDVEVKEDHQRLHEHFKTQVANLKGSEKNRVDLTIDSYSNLD